MKITSIHARQILDSRGNPTIEADVMVNSTILGRAAVPSGASTGIHEAVELRDGNENIYGGKSVLKAVENVNVLIAKELLGKNSSEQEAIDELLITLDGTANKSHLGANALLAVSLAYAKASALAQEKPLYEYFAQLGNNTHYLLPLPQINIFNGGRHAGWATDLQEYIIFPVGAASFSHSLQMADEVFHALGSVLKSKGYATTVGDEGGYAPSVHYGNSEPFELISSAVEKAGYQLGADIVFGIDGAASEFYKEGKYILKKEQKKFNTEQMVSWLVTLTKKYPIVSLEDCLDQEDWEGWKLLTKEVGGKMQIIGDDLLVTNSDFLKRGIKEKAANAILIKLNQIGTVTETIAAVNIAKKNKWHAIISHRSGETEDTTIADFVVGMGTGQIKTGSLCRTDRVAKYNQLLRIEEMLGKNAKYAGKFALSSL